MLYSPLASCVVPPLLWRGNFRAAILHWDAAERVILALRVALPVVRHLDPGERGMAVEDDPEEVPGLPLMPVVSRVHRDQRGDVRVRVWRAHLQPHPAVVRDGQQVVYRVQLTAGVLRVVHSGYPAAQLEAERRVVAELRRYLGQPLPADVEGQLAPVGNHPLDRVGEADPGRLERADQ